MYNLIADFPGYAAGLNPPVNELEDRKIDGVRQHLNRKIYYFGDFVERGPEQLMTVDAANKAVEKGNALTVTGKNELNALTRNFQNKQDRGECLQPYHDKKRKQRVQVFEQVGEGSDKYRSKITWLKTSHLHLDLPNSRMVNSSLHPDPNLVERTYINPKNRLLADVWVTASRKASDVYNAARTLPKGFDIRLPRPHLFLHTRRSSPLQILKRLWQQKHFANCDPTIVSVSGIKRIGRVLIGWKFNPLLIVIIRNSLEVTGHLNRVYEELVNHNFSNAVGGYLQQS